MNRQEIVTLLQMQGGRPLVRVTFLNGNDAVPPAPPPEPVKRRGEPASPPLPPFESFEPIHGFVYKCLTVEKPAVNDIVVVQSRNGYALAKITQVGVRDTDGAINYGKLKHVVGRVDFDYLDRILAEENRVMEQLAMAEINQRLQQVQMLYGSPVANLSTPMLQGDTTGMVEPWAKGGKE